MRLRVLAALAAPLLASCGSAGLPVPGITPYRIEIQQGNFVSQEMVSQLKPGMSKEQVRFVLGTPLIADAFHGDRWDYVFRRQRVNSSALEHRKIAVFFEDGKLKRIEGDVTPAPGAAAPAAREASAAQASAATSAPEAAGVAEKKDAAPVPPPAERPKN